MNRKQCFIIGLTGQAYSGKTTAAKYLEGKGFKRIAFADPLKELAIEYFGITAEDAFINKPPQVRTLLQGIGSLIREQFDEHYFIQEMVNRIRYSDALLFVIDDVRFANEADIIRQMGGVLIRMECPNTHYKLTDTQQNHASEQTAALTVDCLICANYGHPEAIAAELEALFEARVLNA